MVMQSFFQTTFTAKTAQDYLVFVFATVAKDITNLSPHGKYLRIWRRGERPAPTLDTGPGGNKKITLPLDTVYTKDLNDKAKGQ